MLSLSQNKYSSQYHNFTRQKSEALKQDQNNKLSRGRGDLWTQPSLISVCVLRQHLNWLLSLTSSAQKLLKSTFYEILSKGIRHYKSHIKARLCLREVWQPTDIWVTPVTFMYIGTWTGKETFNKLTTCLIWLCW